MVIHHKKERIWRKVTSATQRVKSLDSDIKPGLKSSFWYFLATVPVYMVMVTFTTVIGTQVNQS